MLSKAANGSGLLTGGADAWKGSFKLPPMTGIDPKEPSESLPMGANDDKVGGRADANGSGGASDDPNALCAGAAVDP